ncbi:MAG: methylated-DNA--[protein]-cysteine S-methyltransferase [Melioribacteraceae bacterium]|nr:methylated-DNA--[protein]-cysteine S-methyltransferase [Melioribacteraceae bacterium]
MNSTQIETPIGKIEITEDNNTLIKLKYSDELQILKENKSYYLNKSIVQINEYFEGKRTSFDLKLNPGGTDFQIEVWKEVLKIPYGKTKTYLEIAKAIGDPGAARAVGNANNKNPIPILIPCHRVVGANGN